MARTAVVAGTATAVSNRVSRRQANRWASQDAPAYEPYPEQQYAEPLRQLPARLVRERDRIVGTVGPHWPRAVLATVGRWTFDYLTLLAAVAAVGGGARPGLVLLGFCAAQVLAQIPATPGGLGFVEAGLTAMLVLAGVDAGAAVLATFAYRLVSYWLALPVGAVAWVVHRRRYAADAVATA